MILPEFERIKTIRKVVKGLFNDRPFGLISVTEFGAKGNGATDDTAAIQAALDEAEERGGGGVIIPSGVWLISDALRIPSNTTFRGAGMQNTIIRLKAGAFPEPILPHPEQTSKHRQYRAMVTTQHAGSLTETTTDVTVSDFTIDWDNQPATKTGEAEYANVLMWVANAERFITERVETINGIPSDYENARGANMLYSYAKDCHAFHCRWNEAGYEVLGIRYASEHITIDQNMMYGNNPWRHIIEVTAHPMDGDNCREIRITNNDIYLDGDTNDAISFHGGGAPANGHVSGNVIKVMPGSTAVFDQGLVKFFNNPIGCRFIGNTIDFTEWDVEATFPPCLIRVGSDQGEVSHNLIKGTLRNRVYTDVATNPLIGMMEGFGDGKRITNNEIYLEQGASGGVIFIGQRGRHFGISGNIFNIVEPVEGARPTFIKVIGPSQNFSIFGNVSPQNADRYDYGVVVADESKFGTIVGNEFAQAMVTSIEITTTGEKIEKAGNVER